MTKTWVIAAPRRGDVDDDVGEDEALLVVGVDPVACLALEEQAVAMHAISAHQTRGRLGIRAASREAGVRTDAGDR
jgi:hypothetical protein